MRSCAAMIETLVRLRVELEDWKSKNNKMQAELSQVRARPRRWRGRWRRPRLTTNN